jgi:integrase
MKCLRRNDAPLEVWIIFASRDFDPETLDLARTMLNEGKSIRAVSMALEISWPLAKRIKEGNIPAEKDSHRVTVVKQWEDARAAAGLDPKLVLYCARHEFATTFIENGGDLATLKKIMGHTSIATTQKYLHPDIEGAANIINRRNRAGLKIAKRA